MICAKCGHTMTKRLVEEDEEQHLSIFEWHCEKCGEAETDVERHVPVSDEAIDTYAVDPYYGDPHEPYSLDDDTWGTCPECGSGLVNEGAMSDGDGDLYDSLICPLCQEERGRANEKWFGLDGEAYDSIEEMMTYDALYMEDDGQGEGEDA